MKQLILILCSLSVMSAYAVDEGKLTMSAPTARSNMEKNNQTEAGLGLSSMNEGSAFATVAVMHEYDQGYMLGGRGYLPMQFTKQAQAFMAEAVARFMLVNDINLVFVEANVGAVFFNNVTGNSSFMKLGADIGFMRRLTAEISVGGTVGADFAGTRVTHDAVLGSNDTFYSKVLGFGAFYF